jgi:phthalate 4,5-dioxygenase oxygenase subunit
MKRGDWTGIAGIPRRTWRCGSRWGRSPTAAQDHFGSSDLAVAQFRRMMVAAAKKFQETGRRSGRRRRARYVELASFEGIVPKALDWRTLGARARTEEEA